MKEKLQKILKSSFNLESFREGQKEVIESVINKKDTLVFMPTGWWKSLTYQLPWVYLDGLTIVISPLISLMKDQVDKLKQNWVKTELINSSISYSEIELILENLKNYDSQSNPIKFLYIAPERLNSSKFLLAIKNLPISLIAVDEAHCISQWWHDFRPSYMKIKWFIEELRKEKSFPIIALTATATQKVRKDIVDRLWLDYYNSFIAWFDRKNIAVIVREISKKDEKQEKLLEIINKSSWVWIVYCSSRKVVYETYDFLIWKWIKVWKYTWEMNPVERASEQNKFMSDNYKVIVATNAFGMWIDKHDIRFVIHYNLPWSIENYYQEIGRAWRDWKKSYAVCIASFQDTKIQEFFIENTYPTKKEILDLYDYLYKDIDKTSVESSPLRGSWLDIVNPSSVLKQRRVESEVILKTYSQISRESWIWNDMKVWSAIKILEKYWILQRWADSSGLEGFRGRGITLIQEKRKHSELLIDWVHQENLKEEAYFKLEQIKKLLFTPSCRKKFILKYFWDEEDLEKMGESCGMCDFCIDKKNFLAWEQKDIVQISVFEIVLETLERHNKKFWVKFIANLLWWSKEKRILEWWLSKDVNYWSLADYNWDLILAIIESLIRQDFIEKTDWQYPVIWLTHKWNLAITREYILKDENKELQSYLSMKFKNTSFKKYSKNSDNKKEKSNTVLNTYKQTLELFNSLINSRLAPEEIIKEISIKRNMTPITIETHIVKLYETWGLSLMNILKLTNLDNMEFIKKVVTDYFWGNTEKLKPIKEKLEKLGRKDISYFDIKLCLVMIVRKDI